MAVDVKVHSAKCSQASSKDKVLGMIDTEGGCSNTKAQAFYIQRLCTWQ